MRIHEGKLPDIKPSVKRKLATFVPAMRKLQKLAREVCAPRFASPMPVCDHR